MDETATATEQTVADFKLPVKRVAGEALEERMTENAYERILPARYLLKDTDGNVIETPEELFRRVAENVAEPDREDPDYEYAASVEEFEELMTGLKFMPNSPTLMNAGTDMQQLSACFVVHPEDDMDSIFNGVKDAAKIFQTGGGVGYPFHLMRPKGDIVHSTGGIASGPMSFMTVFDSMCLVPGTRVLTPSGYVPIETLETGDTVIDEDGDEQEVTETFNRRVDEEILVVTPERLNEPIKMTGNHPVKVYRDGEMQWVNAEDLVEDDMLVLQTGQEAVELHETLDLGNIVSGPFIVREQEIELSPAYYGRSRGVPSTFARSVDRDAFARLAGWYLAEGCVIYQRGIPSTLVFTLHIEENSYHEEIMGLLERFDVDVMTREEPARNTLHIKAHNAALAGFFEHMFGTGYDVKTVPGFLWRASPSTQMEVLDALISGDGYIGRHGNGQRASLKMANREIIDFAYHVGLRNGVQFGRYHEENQHKSDAYAVKCSVSTALGTPLEHLFDAPPEGMRISDRTIQKTVQDQQHQLVRIKNLATEQYTGSVHNIEVTNSHTYIAEGVTVHNCGTIKQGGKRRGAQMGIMRIDHPDVLRFLVSKREEGRLSNFNISVGLTDAFMEAVKNDEEYTLLNPRTGEAHEVTKQTAEFYNADEEWYPTAEGSDTGRDDNFWRDFAHTFPDDIEQFDIDLKPGEDMVLPARFIWECLVDGAWRNGEPGLFMYDTSNQMHSFDVEEHPEHKLEATNPCVTGDTLIHTANGLYTAEELYKQQIANNIVVDGRRSDNRIKEASSVYKTGVKDVYTVQTREGYELRVTADHRIMTEDGWVEAQHLGEGDEIHILNRKGGFGRVGSGAEGRAIGWLVGDGQINDHNKVGVLHFYERDMPLADKFAGDVNTAVAENGITSDSNNPHKVAAHPVSRSGQQAIAQKCVSSGGLYKLAAQHGLVEEKLQVPDQVLRGSGSMAQGFLQGLFTADGSVQGSVEKGVSVRLTSVSLDLLKDVQVLLSNFGIASKIYTERHPAGPTELPDGNGGTRMYDTQARHELCITKENLVVYADEIGFLRDDKNRQLDDALEQYNKGPYTERFTATITAVEHDGHEPVYDLTEPDTNSFIANGIVVHNCAEQVLENYEPCNLGHINLSLLVEDQDGGEGLNWEEWRETHPEHDYGAGEGLDRAIRAFLQEALDMEEFERVAKAGTRFLDNVVTMSDFPLQAIEEKASSTRKIGLGLMGFAQMLIQIGVRYGSEEAVAAAKEVQRRITRWSVEESHELAETRGRFSEWKKSKWANPAEHREWFERYTGGMDPDAWEDGFPIRNHNTTTIAPTGTTSMLGDTSGGCEPIFSLAYFKNVAKDIQGEDMLVEFDDYFLKALDANDVDVEAIKEEAERLMRNNQWDGVHSIPDDVLPPAVKDLFVTANRVTPEEHVRIQGAFQHHNHSGISKCIEEGTLIQTDDGLVPVEEFGDAEEGAFGDVSIDTTIDGHDITSHYNAGEKDATRVRLDNGEELVGATESHRVKTPEGWKLMSELEEGDFVVGQFNESNGDGEAPVDYGDEWKTSSNRFETPEHMSPELAEWLGMVCSEGTVAENRVGFTHVRDVALERFTELTEAVFGVTPSERGDKRNDVKEVYVNSRNLVRFTAQLIGTGDYSDTGAYTKRAPWQILRGSPEEKLAFLKGVSLDGYNHSNGFVIYGGMSEELAYHVAQIARSFGLPRVYRSKKYVEESDAYAHGVIVSNQMQELVETIEPEKNTLVKHIRYKVLLPEQVSLSEYETNSSTYNTAQSVAYKQKHSGKQYVFNTTAEKLGIDASTPVHKVTEVEDAGMVQMYDIEVSPSHQYVVNGIVSHNTCNFPNDASREDVAEAYMLAYDLGIKGLTVYRDGTRDVQVLTTRQDNKLEDMDRKDVLSALIDEYDGMDNLLTSSEFQDAAGIHEDAGLVVRKNGDGEGETQTVEAAHTTNEQRREARKPRERPEIISGTTQKIQTGYGSMFTTINEDEDGLFEVFITVGKSGGFTESFTHALGRTVSTALRAGVDPGEIIEQLEGIRSPRIAWDNSEQVLSIPDGVAKAMERYLSGDAAQAQTSVASFADRDSNEPEELQSAEEIVQHGGNPECPDCGGMLQLQEGCKKCPACGWSEC